jgi:hypothetical protein
MRIKAGDTIPMTASLKDGTGTAVNLTGATVVGYIYHSPTGVFLSSGTATVVGDATLGNVSLALSAGQTAAPGGYFVEWKVTFAGGAIQRFPGSSYNEIVIDPAAPAA